MRLRNKAIVGCALGLTAGLIAWLSAGLAASAASAARASGATPAALPPEVVYVANSDSGPVTIYRATSSGRVHPVRLLRNPNLSAGYWDPWNVTIGPKGYVYVQSFLSEATTYVFKPRSSGPPVRVFSVTGPDTQGIAVDPKGYTFVLGGEGPPVISVAAPTANGTAAHDYFVNPVRQFTTDSDYGFDPWPGTLTAGPGGTIVAAIVKTTGNAIEFYHGGPRGSSRPVRVISGPRTGLGACTGYNICDQLSLTYSPYTGRLYVAVTAPAGGARILVFGGGARGNVRPIRVIAGTRTGLRGAARAVYGIADSQRNGDIYVLVAQSWQQYPTPSAVEVFPRMANGDISPLRRFTDASTHLQPAESITVGP